MGKSGDQKPGENKKTNSNIIASKLIDRPELTETLLKYPHFFTMIALNEHQLLYVNKTLEGDSLCIADINNPNQPVIKTPPEKIDYSLLGVFGNNNYFICREREFYPQGRSFGQQEFISFWRLRNNEIECFNKYPLQFPCYLDPAMRSDGTILYQARRDFYLITPPDVALDVKLQNGKKNEVQVKLFSSFFNKVDKEYLKFSFLPDNSLTCFDYKSSIYFFNDTLKMVNKFKIPSSENSDMQVSPNKEYLFLHSRYHLSRAVPENLSSVSLSIYQPMGNDLVELFKFPQHGNNHACFPLFWLPDNSLIFLEYFKGFTLKQFFPNDLSCVTLHEYDDKNLKAIDFSQISMALLRMPDGRIILYDNGKLISFFPASSVTHEAKFIGILGDAIPNSLKDLNKIIADYVGPDEIGSLFPQSDKNFEALSRLPKMEMQAHIKKLYLQLQAETKQEINNEKLHTFEVLKELIKLIAVKASGKECVEELQRKLPNSYAACSKELKKLLKEISQTKFAPITGAGLFQQQPSSADKQSTNNNANNNYPTRYKKPGA